ncbi:hypothetical protein [Streptomyces sp. NBC_01304]|uniref:hypothetical protein n=1 Tax=Streptomyces sp. NBC_01304 TaxID=2903818 RepID=UPI002E1306B9|nr:hypothetical protein OG430_44575 [Streptomyces sp. NBC_01304]
MRLPLRLGADRVWRTEIRVSHHLTGPQLVRWLAWSHEYRSDDLPPRLTGPAMLAAIRDQIAAKGWENLDGWNDDLNPEEESKLINWAHDTLRRHCPDLDFTH